MAEISAQINDLRLAVDPVGEFLRDTVRQTRENDIRRLKIDVLDLLQIWQIHMIRIEGTQIQKTHRLCDQHSKQRWTCPDVHTEREPALRLCTRLHLR